ncbi:hypothetical protein VL10_12845 [Leclercia adecarboxylata]|nr:hypothetical protein VL10_12845 [Leclercia adecarboxylata]KMN61314.1 hypothetical protein VK95_23365 [Leclercia sp. LK8]
MKYLGNNFLVRAALDEIRCKNNNKNELKNLYFIDISKFKTISQLLAILDEIEDESDLSSVLLIIGASVSIPIIKVRHVDLRAPLTEWEVSIKDALRRDENKLKNIKILCNDIIKLKPFTSKEQRVIKLVANGFDIYNISKITGVSEKHIYTKMLDIRKKLCLASIHNLIMYIRREFVVLKS